MKTSIKSIFAAALVAISFASVNASTLSDPKEAASTSYAVNVFRGQEGKVNVLFEKVKGKKLYVTLKDNKGNSLYEERIDKSTTTYARRFDLQGLPDGKYSVEISDGETKTVKEINLSTHQSTIARSVSVK